jgi:hypothetical protein
VDFKGARPTYLGTNLVKTNDALTGSFSDVSIASSVAGQALVWDGSSWVNARAVVDNQPSNNGYISRNYDECMAGQSTSSAGSAGVILLARVELPDRAVTVTNIHFGLGTAASAATNGFVGIYDSGGTRRMVSADQSAATTWTSTTTALKTVAGTGTWSKAAGSNAWCWVAFLTGAATTLPGFYRAVNNVIGSGLTSGATSRWGIILSGQTSLPSTITPGSVVATNVAYWAAIS